MIVFFIVALLLLSIIHGVVGWRIIPALGLSDPLRSFVWGIIPVAIVLPMIPIAFRSRGVENDLIDWFSWAGYISLGFFVLTFFAILAKDTMFAVLSMGQKVAGLLGYAHHEPIDPSRREFIQKVTGIGILAITGTATAKGVYNATQSPIVIKKDIPIHGLDQGMDGFTIAQISDFHIGPTVKGGYVRQVVEQVNRLEPDIIALTGDLVDGSVKYLAKEVAPLKDLSARIGKYFTTGNHEYYSGVDAWLDEVDRLGFTNLVDSHEVISNGRGSFTLGGVTDYRSRQIKPDHHSDPEIAFSGAPKDLPKILLAHQPASIFAAKKVGVDLQLSGHTHGGQFWPFVYAVRMANPYTAGLHDHDGTWIYVNRGTGYWGPPLRIGIPSEITLLKLRSAPESKK